MTTCVQNGCKGGPCAVLGHFKNGVLSYVTNGDPLYRGTTIEDAYLNVNDTLKKNMIQIRPCTRGYLWPRTVNHPDRILYPMKRVGARGSRQFVRITWDEALDTIATTAQQLFQKYGPTFADAGPAASYLGYGYGTWGVSSRASHVMSSMEMFGWEVFGKGNIGSVNNILNIFDTKAVVYLGTNPMMSYQANGANVDKTYFLRYMHEQGVPIIIIDPMYNASCEVLADQYIPIRAGTDMALILALANVLYTEGIYQKDYVAKYVYGFQKWMDYVTGKTAGPDGAINRTPEWAEPITGIPAATIRALAEFMAKYAPQVNFSMYFAVGKKMYGDMTGWADDALKAMLGSIGVQGGKDGEAPFGSVNYISGPVSTMGSATPKYYTAQLIAGDCGSYIEYSAYLDLQAGKITEDVYRRMIGCAADWPLPRPVMRYGKALGVSSMDFNGLVRGLKGLQFIVATGGSWHATNPANLYADIILPSADPWWEQHQGFVRGVSCITLPLPGATRPGQVMQSYWISAQLENRLGVIAQSNPLLQPVLNDPQGMDNVMLGQYQKAYQTWAATPTIAVYNPPSWNDFLKVQVFKVPHVGNSFSNTSGIPYDWFRDTGFMTDPVKNGLDTPSGLMQVYSDWLANPKMPTTGIVTRKGFVAEMCYGGASPTPTPPMPQYVGNIQPDGPMASSASQYPLHILSMHSNYRAHHSNDANPDFRIETRHACWLSVASAKARGIKDGDQVRVYNSRGEMILPAYVTPRVTPGTANVGYGAWAEISAVKTALMPDGIDTRGMANWLTPAAQYPWICGDNACGGTNCQVEKVSSGVVSS